MTNPGTDLPGIQTGRSNFNHMPASTCGLTNTPSCSSSSAFEDYHANSTAAANRGQVGTPSSGIESTLFKQAHVSSCGGSLLQPQVEPQPCQESSPSSKPLKKKKKNVKREICRIENCNSQARAFHLCKRHGGSRPCTFVGCTRNSQSRGFCIKHGGGTRCKFPECTRAAQSQGKCKGHGGKSRFWIFFHMTTALISTLRWTSM